MDNGSPSPPMSGRSQALSLAGLCAVARERRTWGIKWAVVVCFFQQIQQLVCSQPARSSLHPASTMKISSIIFALCAAAAALASPSSLLERQLDCTPSGATCSPSSDLKCCTTLTCLPDGATGLLVCSYATELHKTLNNLDRLGMPVAATPTS